MPHVPVGVFPYGVFSVDGGPARLAAAVEADLIDLHAAADRLDDAVDPGLLRVPTLNPLLASGREDWSALRAALLDRATSGELDEFRRPRESVDMHLAWQVADFVDFYSSIHHARNVGRIFRPDAEPLLDNWRHLPVGYHGRAGTVYVDGTPIHRPSGQRRGAEGVEFGPSTRLDIEVEMGWVVGGATEPGEQVAAASAADHLFGLVLLDDWSARDIQAFEYVPLGPFLGKSFATSVSAWVVPLEALESARVDGPEQTDPTPLPYLRSGRRWGFDIDIEVALRPRGVDEPQVVASVNAAQGLYWNAAQQLAHMTVNGATVRPGDLFGTGTISEPQAGRRGSLLELTWNGDEPLEVAGTRRTYLEDGDEVTLSATFPLAGGRRGPLGPVSGTIVAPDMAARRR